MRDSSGERAIHSSKDDSREAFDLRDAKSGTACQVFGCILKMGNSEVAIYAFFSLISQLSTSNCNSSEGESDVKEDNLRGTAFCLSFPTYFSNAG